MFWDSTNIILCGSQGILKNPVIYGFCRPPCASINTSVVGIGTCGRSLDPCLHLLSIPSTRLISHNSPNGQLIYKLSPWTTAALPGQWSSNQPTPTEPFPRNWLLEWRCLSTCYYGQWYEWIKVNKNFTESVKNRGERRARRVVSAATTKTANLSRVTGQ